MTTREDVWEEFADQFLDTETRTWIPRAALTAMEAGLSRAAAYDVWRFEVTPAVGANLLDVAGEWAGWDREWLVDAVRVCRVEPSMANAVAYRAIVRGFHERWGAIDACMAALGGSVSPQELAASLTWLAEHFFDFCGSDRAPASRESLSRVYRCVFLPAFRPLVGASDGACDDRVQRAVARVVASGPYRTSAA